VSGLLWVLLEYLLEVESAVRLDGIYFIFIKPADFLPVFPDTEFLFPRATTGLFKIVDTESVLLPLVPPARVALGVRPLVNAIAMLLILYVKSLISATI